MHNEKILKMIHDVDNIIEGREHRIVELIDGIGEELRHSRGTIVNGKQIRGISLARDLFDDLGRELLALSHDKDYKAKLERVVSTHTTNRAVTLPETPCAKIAAHDTPSTVYRRINETKAQRHRPKGRTGTVIGMGD